MIIASTLFLASIAASFAIAYFSHQESSYWILRHDVPQGVTILSKDLTTSKMNLGRDSQGYISATNNPTGAITTRAFFAGELLHNSGLSKSQSSQRNESLSLAVRAADIPSDIAAGDYISLYQLHDVKSEEATIPPQLVISSAFIQFVDRKSGNFSGGVSVTISIERGNVPRVLAATTSGRLVIVARD